MLSVIGDLRFVIFGRRKGGHRSRPYRSEITREDTKVLDAAGRELGIDYGGPLLCHHLLV